MYELIPTACATCGTVMSAGASGCACRGGAEARQASPATADTATPAPAAHFRVTTAAPLPPAAELWVERPRAGTPVVLAAPVAATAPPVPLAPAPAPPTPPPPASPAPATGRGWGVRGGRAAAAEWDIAAIAAGSPPLKAAPTLAAADARTAAGRRPAPASAGRLAVQIGVIISALAVVAVVVFAASSPSGGGLLGVPTLRQPAQIGGMARIQTPAMQRVSAALQAGYGGASVHVVSGIYGSGTTPQLVFVGAQGSGTSTSVARLITAIDASATPFTAAPATVEQGGQAYACGPVSAAAFGAAPVLCAWADHNINGFVLAAGAPSLATALSCAVEARAAAQR